MRWIEQGPNRHPEDNYWAATPRGYLWSPGSSLSIGFYICHNVGVDLTSPKVSGSGHILAVVVELELPCPVHYFNDVEDAKTWIETTALGDAVRTKISGTSQAAPPMVTGSPRSARTEVTLST